MPRDKNHKKRKQGQRQNASDQLPTDQGAAGRSASSKANPNKLTLNTLNAVEAAERAGGDRHVQQIHEYFMRKVFPTGMGHIMDLIDKVENKDETANDPLSVVQQSDDKSSSVSGTSDNSTKRDSGKMLEAPTCPSGATASTLNGNISSEAEMQPHDDNKSSIKSLSGFDVVQDDGKVPKSENNATVSKKNDCVEDDSTPNTAKTNGIQSDEFLADTKSEVTDSKTSNAEKQRQAIQRMYTDGPSSAKLDKKGNDKPKEKKENTNEIPSGKISNEPPKEKKEKTSNEIPNGKKSNEPHEKKKEKTSKSKKKATSFKTNRSQPCHCDDESDDFGIPDNLIHIGMTLNGSGMKPFNLDDVCDEGMPTMDGLMLQAAGRGDVIRMKDLIRTGGNPSGAHYMSGGKSPLIVAAIGGHVDILTELCGNCGVDPNSADMPGKSALSYACEFGHFEFVKILILTFKANVNFKDKMFGYTPLMFAALNGNLEIVEFLLIMGADSEAKKCTGKTALNLAGDHGHDEVIALLMKHVILGSFYGGHITRSIILGKRRLVLLHEWYCKESAEMAAVTKRVKGIDVNK